jgi:stage V sporulation protein SpoVS
LIFKVLGGKEFKKRVKNHAFARAVVSTYGLDHLIVPKFGFIEDQGSRLIIYEEKIDIEPSQFIQEEY